MGQVIDAAAAIDRALALAELPGRSILGLTGPPGCGKSTLAAAVCAAVGQGAALVPMDGFHLADEALDALGWRDRKGAPETFDSYGYAALLERLRRNADPVVYAPAFERDIEQPIAGVVAVGADVRLIVTEGNYLLHTADGWPAARRLIDEVWYVDVDESVRLARLVDRHVRFGKSPEHASSWVATVDAPNARLVAQTRAQADCIVVVH